MSGIFIYDVNGNIIMDSNTFILKEVAQVRVNDVPGNVNVAAAVQPANAVLATLDTAGESTTLPRISYSGKQVSYDRIANGYAMRFDLNVVAY